MPNELVIINSDLSLRDEAIASFKERYEKLLEKMSLLEITPENIALLAKNRTAINKAVREMRAELEQAKKPFVSKIEDACDPIERIVSEAEFKAKEYQKQILAASKKADLDRARTIYSEAIGKIVMEDGALDGQPPVLEAIYKDSFSTLSKADLTTVFVSIIREATAKDDPNFVAMFTVKGSKQCALARKVMKEAGVEYREEMFL